MTTGAKAVTLAIIVAVAVASGGAYALTRSSPDPLGDQPGVENPNVTVVLNTVSARGTSVTDLNDLDRNLLEYASHGDDRPDSRAIQLIYSTAGQSYYRIANASGPDCFGIGPEIRKPSTLGQVVCQREFPSRRFPIIDMTVASPDGTILRSEGFAADGVARVRIEATDGSILEEVPVQQNVYRFAVTDGLARASKIIAVTKDGEVVSSSALPR